MLRRHCFNSGHYECVCVLGYVTMTRGMKQKYGDRVYSIETKNIAEVGQSVGQPVGQSVGQSVGQTVGQCTCQLVGQSILVSLLVS